MVSDLNDPEAKIRILHCHQCRTLEEIPDYSGHPDDDAVLEYVMSKHETNGQRHVGKLYDVPARVWALENLRNTIIDQLKGGGSKGLAVIDSAFYDTRDTLKDDALKCYQKHLRPKEGCGDWRSDSKILRPPTKEDRKEVGLSMTGAPRRWLCDWCPVRMHYEHKSNVARGVG